jgi:hypothetical protein
METQHLFMMKMEIFYRAIQEGIKLSTYILLLLLTTSCKQNSDRELKNFSYSLEENYNLYADSINSLNKESRKIPNFISNYNNDLKIVEKTTFHMDKRSIYTNILNLCSSDKLLILKNLIEKKEIKNENENTVLEVITFLNKGNDTK